MKKPLFGIRVFHNGWYYHHIEDTSYPYATFDMFIFLFGIPIHLSHFDMNYENAARIYGKKIKDLKID